MNYSLLYKDKPLFGLDIGTNSIKVMQIANIKKKQHVIGYGVLPYSHDAIKDGVIIKPDLIAKTIDELFKNILSEK